MSQTFIDWAGGPMPVKSGTPVVTRHRHGKGDKHCLAGDGYATRWEHTGEVDDIVAYRVDEQISSSDESPLTISFPVHEIAHNLLLTHTGQEGGNPRIDWYRLRSEISDAIAVALDKQRRIDTPALAGDRCGDWMQTVSGRQFWPLDPRPEDVAIEDIAHALSMMCRFGGHCERFYSVAEHSVLVSENVPPQDALWALLHDASEAYIADVVRPAKRFIDGYKDLEANIMAAVCGAFDLPYIEPPSVKRADNAILADEAAQIMGTKPKDWILPEPPLGVRIIGLPPADAKQAFLARYRFLTEAPHG